MKVRAFSGVQHLGPVIFFAAFFSGSFLSAGDHESRFEMFKYIYSPGHSVKMLPVLEGRVPALNRGTLKQIIQIVKREAARYELDPVFITSLIEIESSFRIYARSSAGALGLMQILPATGRMIASKLGIELKKISDLFRPEINIKLGVWYIHRLLRQFGDPLVAITAYNYGPGNVRKIQRKFEIFPVVPYVIKLVKTYSEYLDQILPRKLRVDLKPDLDLSSSINYNTLSYNRF